jgi:hypothetical protein
MNRREFLGALSAAAIATATIRSTVFAQDNPMQVYKHRVQFGCWINDMRNDVLPRDNWPASKLDDIAERDIINCLALGQETGYNQMDIWGLFATSAYPIDIPTAFRDTERRPRVDRILAAARAGNIKIIYGMGVYSWGFDAIIAHDPAIRGSNPHVMCASSDASLVWQQKLIDTIVSELGVDGFHLESADQGRCTCTKCAPIGDIEYHTLVNIKTADYIRAKYPGKLISCVIQGWSAWGKNLSDADKERLIDLSGHVDVIWDQGHRRTYIEPEKRGEFIAKLKCDYGTSGGFWVYPPPRWDRLRWFFPYVTRTGQHMKELYAQGGRGVMYYQGPIVNPGVELNLAFGGRFMNDCSRPIDEVLTQILEERYRPKNPAALKKLFNVFRKPEETYFANWQEKAIAEHDKMPPPGELHLGPLFGNSPGGPTYASEPFLNRDGRKAYKESLLAAYDELMSCRDQFDDGGRVERIAKCLTNTVADIETLSLGKQE